MREFRAILQTVGGRNEIERAEKLLNSVTVVPDNISKRVTSMTLTSKVKERARVCSVYHGIYVQGMFCLLWLLIPGYVLFIMALAYSSRLFSFIVA